MRKEKVWFFSSKTIVTEILQLYDHEQIGVEECFGCIELFFIFFKNFEGFVELEFHNSCFLFDGELNNS